MKKKIKKLKEKKINLDYLKPQTELHDRIKVLKTDLLLEESKLKEDITILIKKLSDEKDKKKKKLFAKEIRQKTLHFKKQKKKNFNILTDKKSFIKRMKVKIKDKYFPDRTTLINMELLNGFHHSFLVVEKLGQFKYKKKTYIFDNSLKYYNLSAKLWCYDFHEEFTLPIQRKIPLNDMIGTLESMDEVEVEYATNPKVLDRFITAKIAEGIMKGQALDEALKKIMVIAVIGAISSVGMLILFMFKTGMLQSIKLPGMG